MKRNVLFLIILVVLLSLSACIPNVAREIVSDSVESPSTPQPVEKTLSAFNPIQKTNYLMAGIVPANTARETSFNPFEWINNSGYYSGYSSYVTYNYVFFDLTTETYHRLLPTNQYIIYQTAGYPQLVYDPSDPDKPAPPIEFWVYSVVKADINGDGFLDYRDKLTISVSDVGGNGYTELIENVDAILSQYYKDSSTFFVIYNVNEKNFVARINLSTRELISTTEMDLGEDVK